MGGSVGRGNHPLRRSTMSDPSFGLPVTSGPRHSLGGEGLLEVKTVAQLSVIPLKRQPGEHQVFRCGRECSKWAGHGGSWK